MGVSRSFLVIAILAACGDDGGGGGGGSGTVDAKVYMDAPMADASALTGLGQKCSTPAECPTNAPVCISVKLSTGQSNTYCTPRCVEGGTMMTNASGTPTNITPAPDVNKCVAAWSGPPGTSFLCATLTAWTPMDATLMANRS